MTSAQLELAQMTRTNSRTLFNLASLLLCSLLCAGPAYAATDQSITANSCPELSKPQTDPGRYGYRAGLAIVPSPAFLDRPDPSGTQLPNGPRLFGAVEIHKEFSNGYFLVKKARAQVCGYMHANELLTRRRPISGDNENGDGNPAFVKLFPKKGFSAGPLSFRAGPGMRFKVIRQKPGFPVYFKYAEVTKSDATSGDEQTYVLVGRSDTWSAQSSERNFLGWIDKAAIVEWRSRIAAFPNPRTWAQRRESNRPIEIYLDRQSAMRSDRQRAMFREPLLNAPPDPVPYHQSRWPVLDQDKRTTVVSITLGLPDVKPFVHQGFIHRGSAPWGDLLTPYVLITAGELDQLLGYFHHVILDLRRHGDVRKVKEIFIPLISTLTGDQLNPGDHPARWLQRRFHLPFRSSDGGRLGQMPGSKSCTSQFDMILNESLSLCLSGEPEIAHARKKITRNLLKSYEQLRMVSREQEASLLWNDTLKRYIRSTSAPRKWFVRHADYDADSYAWVPLAYFP